jgi:hypothetical protein
MKHRIGRGVVGLLALALSLVQVTVAQAPTQPASALPHLVRFGGAVKDLTGKTMTGVVGITFALYSEQTGGAALWLETQNVTADGNGHYTVLLGATTPDGLPGGLFSSEQAHWVGVQVQGQDEQPRVLLVSAPYALKAADAETLGGKPLSSFVLNESAASSATTQATAGNSTSTNLRPGSSPTVGGSGTTDFVAKFTNSTTIGDSLIFDNGTNVGIGTSSPTAPLQINGNRLLLTSGSTAEVQFVGSAASARFGEDTTGSFFASDTNGKVVKFLTNNGTLNEWMRITSSGNVGIGTTTPADKLDVNGAVNAATSFNLGGAIFASGSYLDENAFLGFAGNSTMTGSSNTASGPAALHSNTSGSGNTACGNTALFSNTTGGHNTATGNMALGSNTTGGDNTAIGYSALDLNSTGHDNTASGYQAAYSAGTAYENTASGSGALYSNTGNDNTADGKSALYSNTTGLFNTASGAYALQSNTTGDHNTALGYEADVSVANLVYATAIGANAVGSESNALVLGGTGSYAVNVGIGTATPSNVFTIASGAGHAIADGWDTYSSRRWKTNIQPLHGALAKVEQLRGVSYDLKDSGKHEIGVIAEEVGEVVPEVVSYEENGKDARGVDYSRLTALLIQATKEQQRQLAKALHQIKQQQGLLRAQSTAIQSLRGEVRETREMLRKVKAQVAATQPRLVATK